MPDHPEDPDDLGLPLNANGPAYTARQARHGVPLDAWLRNSVPPSKTCIAMAANTRLRAMS